MKKILTVLFLSSGLNSFAQNPTWADDVACLVYSHCTPCHNPKGSAPFSLLTYIDAVNNSSYIKIKVLNGTMPPWTADDSYRKFAHSRTLTEREKATIVNWVNQGTVQGNLSNAPAAPVHSSALVISNPDLKLQIPTFTLPTITKDLYRCFVLPTGLSLQKYITGIEIIPGNPAIVHHAQVFYDTTGICNSLDLADPDPGYTSSGGVGTQAATLLGTWVPGSSPIFVPTGMGKRLPANANIVIQIHYPEYSSSQTDSTKVNFLFTGNSVRNISDAAVLNHTLSMVNGPLFIPKNTVKTFYEQFTVPFNFTLIGIGPHGHLLCKKMRAYGVTPVGDTIPLVNIPEWDFHWQGSYDFQQPVKIPAGTRLVGEATYDNTSNNIENPNSPPQDVSVGESTTDEMMLFYFSFLLYRNGDENIVIDTASHKPHHLGCISTDKSGIDDHNPGLLKLSPVPASDFLQIEVSESHANEWKVYNSLGIEILKGDNTGRVNISELPAGVYIMKLNSGNKILIQKFVRE